MFLLHSLIPGASTLEHCIIGVQEIVTEQIDGLSVTLMGD